MTLRSKAALGGSAQRRGSRVPRRIPERYRAAVYQALARGVDAGLPAERSIALCADIAPCLRRLLHPVRRALKRGTELAEAGRQIIWWNGEFAAVQAAQQGGTLGTVLHDLAAYQEQRDANRRRLARGLLLPACVYVTAVMMAPLPALARGDIPVFDYLLRCAGGVFWPLLIFACLRKVPAWLRSHGVLTGPLDELQLSVPIFGTWYWQRERLVFIRLLALLLGAGVPAQRAWCLANSAQNQRIRGQIEDAGAPLLRGGRMSEALAGVDGLDATALAVAQTGEASGRLDEALRQYADAALAVSRRHAQGWATWLPRLLYVLLAVWLGWQLVAAAR